MGPGENKGEPSVDSLMQVPFKPIEFLSRDVRADRRTDGTIILQSNHKLKPYEKHVPAFLAKWAAEAPDRYVATMSKAKRHGKIFIDYLRNTRGASAIGPYSTRARPGAHVAFPVSWQAVRKLKDARPAAVNDAAAKVARMKEPWAGYFKLRQKLPKL